jgi:hypothetical protein
MNVPAHVYAFAIALVGLVGIVVLSALHDTVPQILQVITVAAVTGGAGLAVPSTSVPSTATFKPVA